MSKILVIRNAFDWDFVPQSNSFGKKQTECNLLSFQRNTKECRRFAIMRNVCRAIAVQV